MGVEQNHSNTLRVLACSFIAIVIISLLFQIIWNRYKYSQYIKKIPPAFAVTDILYSKHSSAGFAPSGHEGGIIVYRLPNHVTKQILEKGIRFFHESDFIEREGGIAYSQTPHWQKTPISLNQKWTGPTIGGEPVSDITTPKIEVFVNRWAYLISIDEKIQNSINMAITKPDSFYTYYTSDSIIIVIPNHKQIIFAYNG